MIETISLSKVRDSSHPEQEKIDDSTSIFRLCLEIYTDQSLSDNSKEFLDSMIPEPALVLMVRGDKYLHPEEFETLQVKQLRESVIENRSGIFHRKLNRMTAPGEQRSELCASLLGRNTNDKDVAVGIFYPGGWDRTVIDEDLCYSRLAELQNFYADFTDSNAILHFVKEDNAFRYIIDLACSTVLAESASDSKEQGQFNRANARINADKIVNHLLENNLQYNPTNHIQTHFKNVEISNFSISGLNYAMVSLYPKITGSDETDLNQTLYRAFAHRLNNKLAALQTAADQLMLEEGDTVDSDDVTLAEIIRTEGEHIGNIVRRIGEFNSCGKCDAKKLDLNKLLCEITDHYQRNFGLRHVNFIPRFGEIIISADYTQLKQAFMEMIDNGLNAGSHVRLDIAKENMICISVYNDLTENRINELLSDKFDPFEPFGTLDQERSGMGLPIAKKIIEAHQGQVELKNEKDTGLMVNVYLPVDI